MNLRKTLLNLDSHSLLTFLGLLLIATAIAFMPSCGSNCIDDGWATQGGSCNSVDTADPGCIDTDSITDLTSSTIDELGETGQDTAVDTDSQCFDTTADQTTTATTTNTTEQTEQTTSTETDTSMTTEDSSETTQETTVDTTDTTDGPGTTSWSTWDEGATSTDDEDDEGDESEDDDSGEEDSESDEDTHCTHDGHCKHFGESCNPHKGPKCCHGRCSATTVGFICGVNHG